MNASSRNTKWFVRLTTAASLLLTLAVRAMAHGGGGGGGGGMGHDSSGSFSSHNTSSMSHGLSLGKTTNNLGTNVKTLSTNSFKPTNLNNTTLNGTKLNTLQNGAATINSTSLKNGTLPTKIQTTNLSSNLGNSLKGPTQTFKPTSGAIVNKLGPGVVNPFPKNTFQVPQGGFKTLPSYAKINSGVCFPHHCLPYPWYGPYGGFGYYPFLLGSFGGLGGFGGYGGHGNTTIVTAPSVVPTVATVATTVDGIDLQLVDVRLLDAGDATKQIGPRYRVSFRNVGSTPVDHDFNVSLVAADGEELNANLPMVESRVTSASSGETKFVDLRLPASSFEMGSDAKSEFAKLFVFVDSHQEVKDTNRDNNGTMLERTVIQPAT